MNLSELDNCELGLISNRFKTEGGLKVTILKTNMTINDRMYVNHPSGSIVSVKPPIRGVAVIIHNSDGSTELRSYTPDGLCLSPTYLEHSYNLKTVKKVNKKLPFVIVHKRSGSYLQIRDLKGFSTQKTYHWVPNLKQATISPLINYRLALVNSDDVFLTSVKVTHEVELIAPDAVSKSKDCVCCHAGIVGRAHVRNFPIQAKNAPTLIELYEKFKSENFKYFLHEHSESEISARELSLDDLLEEILPSGFPSLRDYGLSPSVKENSTIAGRGPAQTQTGPISSSEREEVWKCAECISPCTVTLVGNQDGDLFRNKVCLSTKTEFFPKWVLQ